MTVDLLTISYTVERLAEIQGTILDVYANVYADDIASNPFFSMERFEERLEGHTSAGGWGCVIAQVDGEVAGFTYGFTSRLATIRARSSCARTCSARSGAAGACGAPCERAGV
jgi:hypothetical protein